jgi:integrase
MPRRLPKGCVEDRDRRGNTRIYFRERGKKKIRIRAKVGTPEFDAEVERARRNVEPIAAKKERAQEGTLGWLAEKYFRECHEYEQLEPRTRRIRKQIITAITAEPWRIGEADGPKVGEQLVNKFTRKTIEVLRDRKRKTPHAANHRLKAFRALFKWAVEQEHIEHNVVMDVRKLRVDPHGYHTWTPAEVERFQAHHPIGTRARLAIDLLLYTGQRVSDVIGFGPRSIDNGALVFTQHKGRNLHPKTLALPILPVLQATLDASALGRDTFLETTYGKPFTAAGFSIWFGSCCRAAGVPGSAHGLRKAAATVAAERGATPHALMSIFGWSSLAMAQVYTKAANQRRLAEASMHLLAPVPSPSVPLPKMGQSEVK